MIDHDKNRGKGGRFVRGPRPGERLYEKNVLEHHGIDLKDVKTFSKDEWNKVFSKFFRMTVEDLELLAKIKGKLRVSDALVARIVLECLRGGDEKKLNFMLDRTIGRVTDRIEITVPQPYIIQRSDGSIEELGQRIPELEESK